MKRYDILNTQIEIPSITLHKVNKAIIGELPNDCIISTNDVIDNINTLNIRVAKYYMNNKGEKIKYIFYNEVKEERLLCLNDKDYYVIKDISIDEELDNSYKEVTAYSLEHKLNKVDVDVEDIGFQLKTPDEDYGIYSLNDYMKFETGWSFGVIDNKVLNNSDGTEKMRWQESVSTNWYDYITKNVREQFECVPFFNTQNKIIDLYSIDSFGEEITLCLNYDSYIKDLSKRRSSNDLITRLKLVGNGDLDIIDATPSGYDYIEDYSYFIENKEMSDELINDIQLYETMVAKRTITWNELRELKSVKSKEWLDKQMELYELYANIKAAESMIKAYKDKKDTVNEAKKIAELAKYNDQKVILEQQEQALNEEVNRLQASINEINMLCKRETATDDNGDLIFTPETLEELKNFLYYSTYTNDAFLEVEGLLSTGRRELDLTCKPTEDIDIDVINFLSKIIDNEFRHHWKGTLALGDVIVLQDNDMNEYFRYLVGVQRDYKSNGLKLELSNKKTREDSTRVIADWLSESKRNMKTIASNKYLWMEQKKNRINLDYTKGR
ncbi:MAG: hypothetical protein ACRCX2_36115 [Paraclostridium sp.]